MTTASDGETLQVLRRLQGQTIRRMLAVPYPGYSAYSAIVFDLGAEAIQLDLRDEAIADKFEVFVLCASTASHADALPGRSEVIELQSFKVAKVCLLRRGEWQEYTFDKDTIGSRPFQQNFAALDRLPPDANHVEVDVGVVVEDISGRRLTVCADTFPLVFQWCFETANGRLFQATRMQLAPPD